MKLSDFVINSLVEQGITHIFEVCGGAVAHLLDSLYGRNDIVSVSMHHEMAAAIAAEGYARAGGNFGVAMATSGPGATNLITGIGSCYFDSIPCLFITGQVNTYEYKFDRPVRQIGFQETDIVSIVNPIVKKSVFIHDESEIQNNLEEAYYLMKCGRPGPVLLDIPLNVQKADINRHTSSIQGLSQSLPQADLETILRIQKLIESSERPVVLVGGGVRSSHACEELFRFVQDTRIPVVASLMGLDAYPHDDILFVGMIGTYGNRYANLTVANADLVIALGTRLDTRQTGTRPETFARGAVLVHVDIDPFELNCKLPASVPVNSDIRKFLLLMSAHKPFSTKSSGYREWITTIHHYKKRYPDYRFPKKPEIDPNYFFHLLSKILSKDTIICVDVGQVQMWAAQSLQLKQSQRFLTEGGMASIGSGLPMGVGASFAKPDNPVVVIVGDGGFQLNIQELQTVYHHNLAIKIILLNNGGYGMIKQFQEQYFNSRFQSSGFGYSNPDFLDVVRAYKIASEKISNNDEILPALHILFSDMRPGFLEVVIDEKSRVSPKLSVDRPVEDQEPQLPREELKANMIIDLSPECE
jgi:acetolactate synthase I/II/III large subunit